MIRRCMCSYIIHGLKSCNKSGDYMERSRALGLENDLMLLKTDRHLMEGDLKKPYGVDEESRYFGYAMAGAIIAVYDGLDGKARERCEWYKQK